LSRETELYFERTMARERDRIPGLFWGVLSLVALLAMAAMGYHGGVAGTTRSPVTVAVAITFSAVIILIADIERPGEGWVNVSQQPMIDVRDWITAATP
jgi:L-alanine-DL-glutamate epimerase-like enolase superfamily enzyme